MPIRDINTQVGYRQPIEVSTPGNGSTVVVVDHPGGGSSQRYARRPLLPGISTATIFGLVLVLAPLVLLFQYFPGDRGKMQQLQKSIAAKEAAIDQQTQQIQQLNAQMGQLRSQVEAGQAQQLKVAADIRAASACMQPLTTYAAQVSPAPSPTTGGQ